ncbi:MAG TPA: metal ABC transporter permease [Candidatus Lokiarchaeia archaeon]|nr:metal ABC transporter permease [Candidatus Lokiarchaeia archaeon]
MATLIDFFTNLAEPYIQRSIIAAVVLAVTCAIIGIFVIMRKMVFLVDGIAHSAFAGGALAVLLSINPFLTIAAFSIVSATSMGYINEKGKLSNETAIGIVFSFMMAIGIIFIGLIRSYTTGIEGLLFGSITTIDINEFALVIFLAAWVLVVVAIIKKALFFVTFSEDLAKANGLPTRILSYVFLLLVAGVIIICMKAIGVILLLALIVTPAASAFQLTYNINKMMIYAIIIAVVGAIFGFMIAYVLEIAASATIVGVLTVTFLFFMAISPKRRNKKAVLDEALCPTCNRAMSETGACQYCDEQEELAHGHEHTHEVSE